MVGHLDDELRDIKDALEARGVELVEYLLGETKNRAMSNRRVARWGRKGSFVYNISGKLRGQWHDWESGGHGDLLSLIQRQQTGDRFREAVAWAKDWLGWRGDDRPPPRKSDLLRREREAKKAAAEAAHATDEAQKTAKARSIWTSSRSIDGTLGEAYLRGRGISAEQWPDAFRWHDRARALVVAVTDAAGDVVAVQMIAVTADAKKDADRWPGKGGAKTSRGPIGNGFVRLDGRRDAVCLAEGAETGASIWSATGFETRVRLGGMSGAVDVVRDAIAQGRLIVVCRDDDKRHSPAWKAATNAIAEIRAAGGNVREAWPFETRRGDKTDFNDALATYGAGYVQARIEAATVDRKDVARIPMTVDTARRRMDEVVGAFFERAGQWKEGDAIPVEALRGTVGVGKSRAMLRHAIELIVRLRAAGDMRAVVIFAPEHKLNDELARRALALAQELGAIISTAVRRGREAIDPNAGDNGVKMCVAIDDIREAQALWADPDKEVCAVCPHAADCAYLAQKDADADLFFLAHNSLFSELPTSISKRGVAAIVVDESAWGAGLIGCEDHPIEVTLDSLSPGVLPIGPGGPDGGQRLEDMRLILANALANEPNGPIRRAAIIGAGFESDAAHLARKLEFDRKVDAKAEPVWQNREDNRSLGRMVSMWGGVTHAVDNPDIEASGRLELAHNKETKARVIRVRGRKDIAAGWQVPTLLVDALLDIDIVRQFWPTVVELGRLDVHAPHQVIRQATGKSWAPKYMSPEGGDTPAKQRQRRKARAIIMRKVREAGGRVLVIGCKSVVQALDLPPHVLVGWFGAVAGRDEWNLPDGSTVKGDELSCVILLGRISPPVADVERKAGALTGRAPVTIPASSDDGGGMYERGDAERLLRTPDGVVSMTVEADIHPDPMAERLRQFVTAGQLMQAVGRARGVNRNAETPVEVLVLTNVALPMPVDELLDEAALEVSPADRMLAEGGIAFEGAAAAAAFYPDLWANLPAAKKALQRSTGGHSLIGDSIRKCPLVVFQRPGERQRPQTATFDPVLCPDPRAAIEARLGETLVAFEVVWPEGEAVAVPIAVGAELVELPPTPPVNEPHPPSERAPMGAVTVDEGGTLQPIVLTALGGAILFKSGGMPPPAWLMGVIEAGEARDTVAATVESAAPANDVEKRPKVVISQDLWRRLWMTAADAGHSHGDVADRFKMSRGQLANIEADRRSAPETLPAMIEQYILETPPTQGRLL